MVKALLAMEYGWSVSRYIIYLYESFYIIYDNPRAVSLSVLGCSLISSICRVVDCEAYSANSSVEDCQATGSISTRNLRRASISACTSVASIACKAASKSFTEPVFRLASKPLNFSSKNWRVLCERDFNSLAHRKIPSLERRRIFSEDGLWC